MTKEERRARGRAKEGRGGVGVGIEPCARAGLSLSMIHMYVTLFHGSLALNTQKSPPSDKLCMNCNLFFFFVDFSSPTIDLLERLTTIMILRFLALVDPNY